MIQRFDHSLNNATNTYSEPFDNVITTTFLTDTQWITIVPNIIVKIINDFNEVIEPNSQACHTTDNFISMREFWRHARYRTILSSEFKDDLSPTQKNTPHVMPTMVGE